MMPALQALRTFIRTSTSSMTSVPKPLKFLRPFYEELGKIRRVWHPSMVEERVSLIPRLHGVVGVGECESRFDGTKWNSWMILHLHT